MQGQGRGRVGLGLGIAGIVEGAGRGKGPGRGSWQGRGRGRVGLGLGTAGVVARAQRAGGLWYVEMGARRAGILAALVELVTSATCWRLKCQLWLFAVIPGVGSAMVAVHERRCGPCGSIGWDSEERRKVTVVSRRPQGQRDQA